jgi:hypothetical protein
MFTMTLVGTRRPCYIPSASNTLTVNMCSKQSKRFESMQGRYHSSGILTRISVARSGDSVAIYLQSHTGKEKSPFKSTWLQLLQQSSIIICYNGP